MYKILHISSAKNCFKLAIVWSDYFYVYFDHVIQNLFEHVIENAAFSYTSNYTLSLTNIIIIVMLWVKISLQEQASEMRNQMKDIIFTSC